jgi:H+/Na+-translocating ferredoxin:NAD+ oxidoreductase subunit D
MNTPEAHLLVSTSPFLKDRADTAWIMRQVSYSLIPVLAAATWFFGVGVLLVAAATILGALLPEWLLNRRATPSPLLDGSAFLTGLLLALTLPPGIPLWMAFLGGFFAVLIGKSVFGGIGANIFNPALVGRALLQAAFPASLTSWNPFGGWGEILVLRGAPFTAPFLRPDVDAVTMATPLSTMMFDGTAPPGMDMSVGAIPGSLGETAALLILVCGLYLAARGIVNWRIPVAMLGAAWLMGQFLHILAPAYPTGSFHLAAGGLMLGAWYMASDPVTSPITQAGCWIFGALTGVLVVIIRVFGGLPEGVMYAILFMNACTPLINRFTQPRTFGTRFKPTFTR